MTKLKTLGRTCATLLLSGLIALPALAAQPVVVMDTSMGRIEIELNQNKAPATVKNFLSYTSSGFYNGTVFHRVIDGFMIQGGGFATRMNKKTPQAPIANESANGLENSRGTIAMARTSDPDSATSQFFINLVDNRFLNGSSFKPGYAVFGKVINGMDVVDRIAKVKTERRGPHGDVPVDDVTIRSVSLKQPQPTPKQNSKPTS